MEMEIEDQLEKMQLVTRKRAAQLMDCSVPHIDALVKRGDLDPIRIGSQGVRITLASLQRFIGHPPTPTGR